MKFINIASRESILAIAQADLVADAMKIRHNVTTNIKKVKTLGDKILDQPLSKIGGKGLFLKELEKEVYDGEVDIAVHSMKDIPIQHHSNIVTIPVLKRAESSDVFVSLKHKDFYTLPLGAKIGTSSHRRKGQILSLRDDINIVECRGNINTRIEKLKKGFYDAIVIAGAGLHRIGEERYIRHYFTHDQMLPAATQGILAVQVRSNNLVLQEMINDIIDGKTNICAVTERSFLKGFGADCNSPVAAYSHVMKDNVCLKVGYYQPDGSRYYQFEDIAPIKQAKQLGVQMAKLLKKKIAT